MDGKIKDVVLFTTDSLFGAFVLNRILPDPRIKMIVLSHRFGGKYGSLISQTVKNFRRSGCALIMYFSCVFLFHRVLSFLTQCSAAKYILRLNGRFLRIKQIAKLHHIQVVDIFDIQHDPVVLSKIREYAPDLIISCYFDQLIPAYILSLPRLGAINIHPGLLPQYRGPLPTFWALKNGEHHGGVAVHIMDATFDTGDILKQIPVNFPQHASVLACDRAIFERIPAIIGMILEYPNVPPSLPQWGKGNYYALPRRNDIRNARKEKKVILWSIQSLLSFARTL